MNKEKAEYYDIRPENYRRCAVALIQNELTGEHFMEVLLLPEDVTKGQMHMMRMPLEAIQVKFMIEREGFTVHKVPAF